jgi:hypothetical protein
MKKIKETNNMKKIMMTLLAIGLSLLPMSIALSSASISRFDNKLVRFKGGIGVIPISNVVVDATGAITVNRNMVKGVNSPGQPWRIKDLEATIKNNGDIKIEGEGLLLAGGNNIGTNAGQSVAAQLFCGDQAFTSPGVTLEDNGDFKIKSVLSPLPLPGVCETPVLLIRSINLDTGVLGAWFAAGILDLDDHDQHSSRL